MLAVLHTYKIPPGGPGRQVGTYNVCTVRSRALASALDQALSWSGNHRVPSGGFCTMCQATTPCASWVSTFQNLWVPWWVSRREGPWR